MKGLSELVLFFYLFSNSICDPTPWSDYEDYIPDVEEESNDFEPGNSFGPDVGHNVVFTILPQLPTQEELPDPELSYGSKPLGLHEDGLETQPTTTTTRPDCACSSLEEKVDQLLSKLKDQERKLEVLESTNKNLLNKIDQVEQQTKANNVIFLNVRETKNENFKSTLQKILHILNRIMKLRISADEISVALRVNSNSTQVRPIVVRFNRFETKMKVLGARGKLNRSNIDISSDYSELVNQRRKDLMPFLLEKRSQGHKAFIVYDKLMVNGVKMTLEELQSEERKEEEKPEERNLEVDSTEGVQVPVTEQEPDEQVEEVEVDPVFECDYE